MCQLIFNSSRVQLGHCADDRRAELTFLQHGNVPEAVCDCHSKLDFYDRHPAELAV